MALTQENIPKPTEIARTAGQIYALESNVKSLANIASNARIYGLIKGPDLGMGGKQICTIDISIAGRKMQGPQGNTINTEKALVTVDQWGMNRLFRYGHEKGKPVVEEVPWERVTSHGQAKEALGRVQEAMSKQFGRIEGILSKEETRKAQNNQKLTKVLEGAEKTTEEASRRWGVDLKAVRQARAIMKAVVAPFLKRIQLAGERRPAIKAVIDHVNSRVDVVKGGARVLREAAEETRDITRKLAQNAVDNVRDIKENIERTVTDLPGRARGFASGVTNLAEEVKEGVREVRNNPAYSRSESTAMAKAAIEQRERRQEDLETGMRVSQTARAMHESFVQTVPKMAPKSVAQIATNLADSEKARWSEKMNTLNKLAQEFSGAGWSYLNRPEPAEGLGKRVADVSVRLLVEQELLPAEVEANNAWLTVRPDGSLALVSAQIKWGSLMKLSGRAPSVGQIKQVALTPEIAEALGDEVMSRAEIGLRSALIEANQALDKHLERNEARPTRGTMASAGLAMKNIKANIKRRIQEQLAKKPKARTA